MHGDFVPQSVLIVSGPWERAFGNRVVPCKIIQRVPPSAINRINNRRAGKCEWTIPMTVDSMLYNHGKVLVSTKVGGPCFADFPKGFFPARLGPPIRVQVSEQAVIGSSMDMNCSTKGSLG